MREKVICKKSSKNSLIKDNVYFYGIVKDSLNNDRYLIDDGKYLICDFSKYEFDQNFYSIKEIRTEKLNKINENIID